jgi:hypothetical protein
MHGGMGFCFRVYLSKHISLGLVKLVSFNQIWGPSAYPHPSILLIGFDQSLISWQWPLSSIWPDRVFLRSTLEQLPACSHMLIVSDRISILPS